MKVLYFGIFDSEFSRNKIYADGLKLNGASIVTCTDNSPGFLKFWKLLWKHWEFRDQYDIMIVGFPGYIIVPFR